ncbi:hypothetical protein [Achromobacter pulmonis]|uniref:hypothetical protein n=1 Tax=Achromobacter pulmonis TaxID=1389932 RepID=UPI001F240A29|nr:hypothetical protein [Achromobacter pulmonis]MCF7769509.1 hypothetical protein [Achromobacter pulmonis]
MVPFRPSSAACSRARFISAELRAGGREYNEKSSPRHGSYLRGRQAIAALFPGTTPWAYEGDVTLYGGQ